MQVKSPRLTTMVKEIGEKFHKEQVKDIPMHGLKRCCKSCRLRWLNYLKPEIKRGNISLDEEDLIIRLHKLLGDRWSLISGGLPGRTDNEIKNYWNTTLEKKVQCCSGSNLTSILNSTCHEHSNYKPKKTKKKKKKLMVTNNSPSRETLILSTTPEPAMVLQDGGEAIMCNHHTQELGKVVMNNTTDQNQTAVEPVLSICDEENSWFNCMMDLNLGEFYQYDFLDFSFCDQFHNLDNSTRMEARNSVNNNGGTDSSSSSSIDHPFLTLGDGYAEKEFN